MTAPITVVSVERQNHILALGDQGNLYLDGNFLGRATDDEFLRHSVEKWTVVSVLLFRTASGQSHYVASHPCEYFTQGELRQQFPTEVDVDGYPLTYPEIWYAVKNSYMGASQMPLVKLTNLPMRRNARLGILTNGRIRIPLDRPRYSEWRQFPDINCLKAVTSDNWPLMLEILEGNKVNNVFEPDLINRQIAQVKIQRKQQARLERRRQQFAKAQCLRLQDVEATIVGDNILYEFHKGNIAHFAVDSFNYGVALYFFRSRQAAEDWANRRVSARAAKAKAIVRITHHPGWSSKAQAYLPSAASD